MANKINSMETKIIFRPTIDKLEDFVKLKHLINAELVIVPKDMQVLIKDKEGFWSVVE